MKIYVETETLNADQTTERRPRQLLLETAAPADAVKAALGDIAAGLGAITVVPPAAHEANLRAILPRDLAAKGITPGTGAEGEVVLKVRREPGQTGAAGQADVIGLSYSVN